MLSSLKLDSSHGDQNLNQVRFVAHVTSSITDTYSAEDVGLSCAEGQSAVSGNLVYARDLTINPAGNQPYGINGEMGEPGSVLVFAVPEDLSLGYGAFTSAYIDRGRKRITGAPVKYAGSRNHLAFYSAKDTESQRLQIESEVANGYVLGQHQQVVLERQYLVGKFESGTGFSAFLNELDVNVKSLKPIDFDTTERNLTSFFKVSEPANAVLAPTLIHNVIISTAESILMSRLRVMRWQGLALLGYSFFEEKQEVNVPPVSDLKEQRRRMDDLGRQLASSTLFIGELAWTKIYVARELDLMRVELEAADLDSLPD
jgi:hypothetical protein